jgi:hypothetical protein
MHYSAHEAVTDVYGGGMTMMEFRDLLSQVTTRLEGRELNSDLEAQAHGPV